MFALGRLKLTISRGRIKAFKQSIAEKFRSDVEALQRLLHVGGMEFHELNVGMNVGDRRTTLSVTANHVPSFVYNLNGQLTDTSFYAELTDMVTEVAPVLGMPLGEHWEADEWSQEATDAILDVEEQEVTRDGERPEPQ